MNSSSILVSALLRKDHIKSENIYSDIFKYECGLTKYDLILKHELLQFYTWKFSDNLRRRYFSALFENQVLSSFLRNCSEAVEGFYKKSY